MTKHSTKDSENTRKSGKEQIGSLYVSTSFLAQLFGKTDRTISSWAKDRGMPKIKHGLFDLKAVLAWWLQEVYESEAEASNEDIQAVKLEYWKWKTENEKMKAQQTSGELVALSDISLASGTRAVEFTRGLEFLEHRLPPLLHGKTALEMRPIIRKETRAIRENYVRKGRFCELPNEGADGLQSRK
jgi:phage terminase Nu1 subunit (DNA packaging protein)